MSLKWSFEKWIAVKGKKNISFSLKDEKNLFIYELG